MLTTELGNTRLFVQYKHQPVNTKAAVYASSTGISYV